MPTTRPWGASSAACWMERPGPYPISRTWSPGWTSSNWTVQALRRRLLSRRAITTPASAPRAPEGWPNWLRTRLRRLRLLMKCSDRLPDRGAQRGERSAGAGELLGVDVGGQVEPREEAPLTVGDPPGGVQVLGGLGGLVEQQPHLVEQLCDMVRHPGPHANQVSMLTGILS